MLNSIYMFSRGLIMGVWNSHLYMGNILGSLIAGSFVNNNWGLSFIIPGIIICVGGLLIFIFLVPKPEDIDNYRMKRYSFPVDAADGSIQRNFLSQTPEGRSDYTSEQYSESDSLLPSSDSTESHAEAISFLNALKIPGVVEFSLCLFFAKLVSYTFLFWLPNYIKSTTRYDAEQAADLSTIFDVGGIFGGIAAGFFSDLFQAQGMTCSVMFAIAAPLLFLYNIYGNYSLTVCIGLLLVCGAFVNGPYGLITTAVSADLGTHPCLQGNAKALATVTAIIDGTGSIGAAVGPLLTGLIAPTGWQNVFYMLITADLLALLLLLRPVIREIRSCRCGRRGYQVAE